MNEFIIKALAYEQENKAELSLKYYIDALIDFPEDKEVLYFAAVFYFRACAYDLALDLFVRCHSHNEQTKEVKKELLNHIFAAYYKPNLDTLKKTYDTNLKNFSEYEHNHITNLTPFEELRYILVPRDDFTYYVFDKANMCFEQIVATNLNAIINTNSCRGECLLLIDMFHLQDVETIHSQTYEHIVFNKKIPIYLLWIDQRKIQIFLQLYNYDSILNTGRFVLLSDYKKEPGLITYLMKGTTYYPTVLYVSQHSNYADEIKMLINMMTPHH